MLRKEIESFLLNKKGYLKKSPLKVAKAIWKNSAKTALPKSREALLKEMSLIKEVQKNLRYAKEVQNTVEDEVILETYEKILHEKNRPKRRLFFDIEVSPNIVFSWRIGYDINLPLESIIQERAIICVCYRWEGDEKVYSLQWNKGDDKDLLVKFSKIVESTDELITQNGDSFDIKWLRTRCLHHGILIPPKFNSLDTLKMARAGFKFNSNKLDYMGQFLGVGKKIKTDSDLWRNITLFNDKKAMNDMVEYCKQDVLLLEKVYEKLQQFSPKKKFRQKI
jgi:hypothetical protein